MFHSLNGAGVERMLILSVKAGAGHLRAAEALEEACLRYYPEINVLHVNALEYTNPVFSSTFTEGWEILARSLPSLWGMIYEGIETKKAPEKYGNIETLLGKINSHQLIRLIKTFDPQRVICTHFMPAKVIGALRLEKKINSPLGVVITDFDFHSMWIQPGTDRYFVATEEMAFALRPKIDPYAKVHVTGIPVRSDFSRNYQEEDREAIKNSLSLKKEVPVVLVLAGGFGLIPVDKYVRAIAESLESIQIIVMAGKHEKFQKKVRGIEDRYPDKVKSYSFVNNIHEFMACADVIITKSGGLTSSECLAMGKPMVIIKPIPGHEERNAAYLLEHSAGIWITSPDYLVFKLQQLLADKARLSRMKEAALKTAKIYAARDIIETMVEGE